MPQSPEACRALQHDALTALEHHGLPLPEGASSDLRTEVETEATRRMTALVAPAAGAAAREDVLRLSMGRLFEQARAPNPRTSVSLPYSPTLPCPVWLCGA